MQLDSGRRRDAGHDRDPGPGGRAAASRPGPRQLNIIGGELERRQLVGQRDHHPRARRSGYNPNVGVEPVPRRRRHTPTAHALQNAIDARGRRAAWSCSRRGPTTRTCVMWKRIILQGVGPGGIIGAHELQTRAPEDARFTVQGSVLDGRFFQDPASRPRGTPSSTPRPYAGVDATHPVPRGRQHHGRRLRSHDGAYSNGLGAAPDRRHRPPDSAAARAPAASSCRPTRTTSGSRTTSSRATAASSPAAIGVGPARTTTDVGSHNFNVKMLRNRVLGSGGLTAQAASGSSTARTTTRSRTASSARTTASSTAAASPTGVSARRVDPRQPGLLQHVVDSGGGIVDLARGALSADVLGDRLRQRRHRAEPDPEQHARATTAAGSSSRTPTATGSASATT